MLTEHTKQMFTCDKETKIWRLPSLLAQAKSQRPANAAIWARFGHSPRLAGMSALFSSLSEADERKQFSVKKRAKARYWSGKVTRESNALDLERGVFKQSSARRIALSLKRSTSASHRRKGSPYQSAMSMLNFYINRAGSGLSQKQKEVLSRAKGELRKVVHRD